MEARCAKNGSEFEATLRLERGDEKLSVGTHTMVPPGPHVIRNNWPRKHHGTFLRLEGCVEQGCNVVLGKQLLKDDTRDLRGIDLRTEIVPSTF